MGTKSTTETSIEGAGGMENSLMQLLSTLAKQSGGSLDLSALGKLASGEVGGPSEQDYQLLQDSIGRTGEMARREMERSLGPMLAQLGETNTSRGIKGSSMEMLNQVLGGQDLQHNIAQMLSQSQQQGGEALMNLPFRRAETQLGANQTLFNMITGASSPVLQNLLAGRMSNTKTTTKSPMNPMDLLTSAASIGGLPMFSNMFKPQEKKQY